MYHVKRLKGSLDTVLHCGYAIRVASELPLNSLNTDLGIKKLLAASFEHAFYLHVHMTTPRHIVQFLINFSVFDHNGTS